jgi:hypothetical protein
MNIGLDQLFEERELPAALADRYQARNDGRNLYADESGFTLARERGLKLILRQVLDRQADVQAEA